jgi:hypothetical protein
MAIFIDKVVRKDTGQIIGVQMTVGMEGTHFISLDQERWPGVWPGNFPESDHFETVEIPLLYLDKKKPQFDVSDD